MLAALLPLPLAGAPAAEDARLELRPLKADVDLNREYFLPAKHIGHQGVAQNVIGPMQDDEALLLYALVQTTHVARVLELGGLSGFSARTFLTAMHAKRSGRVYTVDLNKVPQVQWSGGSDHRHVALVKDAARLEPADVDFEPLDLVLLDCHDFNATRATFRQLKRHGLLRPDAYLVLHDTGLHSRLVHPVLKDVAVPFRGKLIHQPVERIFADWLPVAYPSDGWQRISLHDDSRQPMRHGLTIMQRRVSMQVPKASCDRLTGEPSLCPPVEDDNPTTRPPPQWSVILKLHRRVGTLQLSSFRQYLHALGERLLILFDETETRSAATGDQEVQRLRQLGARVCEWNFDAFKDAFPKLVREHVKLDRSRRQRTTFPGQTSHFLSSHIFVSAPLLMLAVGALPGCDWRLSNQTWVVEADAIFTGQVRRFFENFASETADLVSTNYMLADETFWGTALKWHQGLGEIAPFDASAGNRIIRHHSRSLPNWACDVRHEFVPDTSPPGWCADALRVAGLRGWLYRAISVERLSLRLITHIAQRVREEGIALTGELFESSICLNETAWCTIADWAFGAVRGTRPSQAWPSVGYRSEHYTFHPSKLGASPRMSTSNVWYHPVKPQTDATAAQRATTHMYHASLARSRGAQRPPSRSGHFLPAGGWY